MLDRGSDGRDLDVDSVADECSPTAIGTDGETADLVLVIEAPGR